MAKIFGTKAKNYIKSDTFEIKKYIKKFDIKELKVGHEAQRSIDEEWVQEIIENWDERTCTPLVVVIENENNLVVDGQHRYRAMVELGYKQIECYVIEGISASEAFLMINNIKPIEAIDKFNQKAKTSNYENAIKTLFDNKNIKIAAYSTEDYYFSDVEYLWSLEENYNTLAMDASLTLITQLLEYEGKISKQLLSKLYTIFNDYPEGYNNVYEYILKLKLKFQSENLNSRTVIKKLHKRFPKSKVDIEILKLIK